MKNESVSMAKKQYIDKEKLKRMLPKGSHHSVTDEIIETINKMEQDTGLLQEYMEESLLSHLPVLRETKVDLTEYINAIKYCNLKRNMSNQQAWEIVFPDRYKKLVEEGRWNSSHVSMYNSTAIVVKIDTQMILAMHIQYAPLRHKALMKEAELMNGHDAHGNECSAMVQHLAASKILDMTAIPQEQKIDLKIGQSDEAKNSQEKMLDEMRKIAENQERLLKEGHKIEDIQKLNMTISDESENEEYIDIEENE